MKYQLEKYKEYKSKRAEQGFEKLISYFYKKRKHFIKRAFAAVKSAMSENYKKIQAFKNNFNATKLQHSFLSILNFSIY